MPTRSKASNTFCARAGIHHTGLAAQRQRLIGADLLQPLVDLGVDAGDEEGGHRGDAGQGLPVRGGLLQAFYVRGHGDDMGTTPRSDMTSARAWNCWPDRATAPRLGHGQRRPLGR
jgi:hypothetical protein